MMGYADQLEARFGSSQQWLINFLRRGYSRRYWEPKDPFVQIYILDSVDGALQEQRFQAIRSGPVGLAFICVLHSRPSRTRNRLILVHCGQLGYTNGAYIDAIAGHFELDPMFLCAHFQQCLFLTQSANFMGATRLPVAIPSDRDFIAG